MEKLERQFVYNNYSFIFEADTSARATRMSNDLEKKCEENAAQHEEILYLSEEIKVLKEINGEIFEDNTQLHKFVEELKASQSNLNLELMDLKVC
jgi:hypothetical protein